MRESSYDGCVSSAYVTEVAVALGPDRVSLDPNDLQTYGRDWTKVHTPNPSAILFPRSTGEVSSMMKLARKHGVAIVPSGGRTGLAAGAVAHKGEAVLSLSKMSRIGAVDPLALTVHAEAGAITEAVHQHTEPLGLTWPVDFASKGSSTVGGNIATNAGGVRVIRYGLTRQWVLGLTVVLPSGDVLELGGALEKNNTGIDLRQLFIGSEGILGIVTEATLKLTRIAERTNVLLLSVADLAAVLRLFEHARKGPFVIAAFEFFTDKCLARVQRHRKVRPPVSESTHYVLLEVEEAHDLDTWLEGLFEGGFVSDGVLAANTSDARDLWVLREGISESLSATGLPHKNDIALPIAELRSFTEKLEAVFSSRYADWEICLFGHIGDGNLHVNVMKPEALSKEAFLAKTSEVDHVMFELVREHKGSISAEHGIGLLKRNYLHYTRTEEEIRIFRQLKQVFDPEGLLNPGKVI